MVEDADAQRALAVRLLAHEAEGSSDPSRVADALDRVCRELHSRQERLIGDMGARAIVQRAVTITRRWFPFLAAGPVSGDAEYMNGLGESLRGQDPTEATEAVTSLLANCLAVTISLLGKDITYVLLREACPEVEIP